MTSIRRSEPRRTDARRGDDVRAEKANGSSSAQEIQASDRAGSTRATDGADRYAGSGKSESADFAAVRQDASVGVTLVERDRISLDVASASGVVAMGKGRFLIVDDDKGIYLQSGDDASKIKCAKKHDELKDLEGICRTPDGEGVLVVSEERGEVYRLRLDDDDGELDLGKPEKIGRLPKLSKTGSNKGWEGIDVVPGKFFDDREPRLVAVHEGSPKRVGVFAFPDLEEGVLLALPRDVEKKLKDLSDVAVDPKTGHLFVLSDESELIVELRITKKTTNAPGALLESLRLETVGTHEVDAKKGEKPEGLDFGPDGTLWLAMDGRSSLLAFDVER